MKIHFKKSKNYFKPVECGLSIENVYDYTNDPRHVTCKKCLKLIKDPCKDEVKEIINSEYQLFR